MKFNELMNERVRKCIKEQIDSKSVDMEFNEIVIEYMNE